MMAEYVDNNEDGEPDDALVVQKMLGQKATLLLMTNESENDKIDFDSIERAGFTALQGLYADETLPQGSGPNGFDATIEEVLHLVSSSGIAKAYPDIFGENPGTALANAMDKARVAGLCLLHLPIPQNLGIIMMTTPVTTAAWLPSISTGH